MTDFYLITGFLGAGKTSFLKKFAKLFRGKKISLIINEFGKEDIDSHLLEDLQARLKSIIQGSIFCVCRLEDFENALSDLLEDNPDVLLVETSGLSDPSAINQILQGPAYAGRFNYKGCICIADALNFKKVIGTALVSQKQISLAGTVLLNKIDLADDLDETKELIREHNPAAHIVESSFGAFPSEAEAILLNPGAGESLEGPGRRDLTLQSYLIKIDPEMTRDDLEAFIKLFIKETHRIKGFVKLTDGDFFVDCVADNLQIKPGKQDRGQINRLVALSGKGMATRAALRAAIGAYDNFEIIMES